MLKNLLIKITALFFLLSPFIPLEFLGVRDLRGSAAMTPVLWLLSITIVLAVALLLSIILKWLKFDLVLFLSGFKNYFIKLPLLIPISLLLISAQVFKFRPHLIDSIIQLFQANIIAGGNISIAPPIPYAFIANQHIVNFSGELSSQYPPGYALILSLGALVKMPWLIDIILSSLSAMFIYKLTCKIYDQLTAGIAALLLLFSLYFQALGVSYMNHVGCLFFLSAAVYLFALWEESRGNQIVFSVFCFSLALIIRPLTAVAVGFVFALSALKIFYQRRLYVQAFFSFLAVLPAISLWGWYNFKTTGAATLSGYIYLWGKSHGLGFHTSPWGDVFTFAQGLKNQLFNFSALNEYLFESLLPGLLPLGLYFLINKDFKVWDLRLLTGFLSIPILYIFYWHNDNFLGPRFLYESLIFIIPLSARALCQLFRENNKLFFLKRFIILSLLVCFAGMLFSGIPGRLKVYSSGLRSFKKDIIELGKAANIRTPAVIFVHTSFGDRIISKLKSVEPSAARIETIYRFSDHCDLNSLADNLYNQRQSIPEAEFSKLTAVSIVKISDYADPSLRLKDPQNIPPDCLEELQYDSSGFTIYAPFLTDNKIDFTGDFVILRDLRQHNIEAAKFYPNYSYYHFDGNNFKEIKF